MIKVYLISPYTIGDKEMNITRSLLVAQQLIEKGYAPYWPLWMHYLIEQPEYETCMNIGMAHLIGCDYVLRISGKSAGGDREEAEAEHLGIPVCYSIEMLDALVMNDKLCGVEEVCE